MISKCEYLSTTSLFRHSWDTALLSGEEKPQSQLKIFGQVFFLDIHIERKFETQQESDACNFDEPNIFIVVLISLVFSFTSELSALLGYVLIS